MSKRVGTSDMAHWAHRFLSYMGMFF